MTETEKKRLYSRVQSIEQRFFRRYPKAPSPPNAVGQICFRPEPEHYILVTGIGIPSGTAGSIVIEHAHSKEDYEAGRFADGDLFPMAEMSEEEMFEAMTDEIEKQSMW